MQKQYPVIPQEKLFKGSVKKLHQDIRTIPAMFQIAQNIMVLLIFPPKVHNSSNQKEWPWIEKKKMEKGREGMKISKQ